MNFALLSFLIVFLIGGLIFPLDSFADVASPKKQTNLGISSDKIIGIICNENCGYTKEWTIDDITIIQEICIMLEPIFDSLH